MLSQTHFSRSTPAFATALALAACAVQVAPPPASRPAPPAVNLELKAAAISALRATQQTIGQLLVCDSLEPGLLERLSKLQAQGIHNRLKDLTAQLHQLSSDSKVAKPQVGGLSEGVDSILTKLSQFNAALRVHTQPRPADQRIQDEPFSRGVALYKDISKLASAIPVLEDLRSPPLTELLSLPAKVENTGSARLDSLLGLPNQAVEVAAEKVKLEAEAAKRRAEVAAAEEKKRKENAAAARLRRSFPEQAADLLAEVKAEIKAASIANSKSFSTAPIRSGGEPLYVKIADNSLLKFENDNGRLVVSKNASGYAEYGVEVGVSVKVMKVGGGRDWSTTNIYNEITYLEALAYADYNLEKLMAIANAQASQLPSLIDPNLIRSTLAPLVCDRGATNDTGAQNDQPLVITWGPKHMTSYPSPSIPVYVRLNDTTMLRMTQFGSSIKFERNASGYGVSGYKVDALVVSGNYEYPTMNGFVPISPAEAIAYFDGDWGQLYKAALRQAITVGDTSVWPNVLLKALRPREKELDVKRIKFSESFSPPTGLGSELRKIDQATVEKWADLFKFSIPD